MSLIDGEDLYSWLKDIEQGDSVIVEGRYSSHLAKVERTTKTWIVVNKQKYRRADGEPVRHDKWDRFRLAPVTRERIQELQIKRLCEQCRALMREIETKSLVKYQQGSDWIPVVTELVALGNRVGVDTSVVTEIAAGLGIVVDRDTELLKTVVQLAREGAFGKLFLSCEAGCECIICAIEQRLE